MTLSRGVPVYAALSIQVVLSHIQHSDRRGLAFRLQVKL